MDKVIEIQKRKSKLHLRIINSEMYLSRIRLRNKVHDCIEMFVSIFCIFDYIIPGISVFFIAPIYIVLTFPFFITQLLLLVTIGIIESVYGAALRLKSLFAYPLT